MGTAVMLGVRHGIDWDHIAAINDIAGADALGPRSNGWGIGGLAYGFGHVLSVLLLVLVIRTMVQSLPGWFDPIMERLVGVSLVVLGVWLFVSIARGSASHRHISTATRWTLIANAISRTLKIRPLRISSLGLRGCFCVGVLHGIGAETGTQVALLSSVGGMRWSSTLSILLSFCVGLLFCSWIIAIAFKLGLSSIVRFHYAAVVAGGLTATFSVVIGGSMLLGPAGVQALSAVGGLLK